MNEKGKIVRRASLIALWGNLFLASLKIVTGLLVSSLAVLGDGIDSSTDVIIALMSFLVAGIITRPADRQHPWGHGRAETIATTILAFVLFFAGAQLILRAGEQLFSLGDTHVPSPVVLVVSLCSIGGKVLLAWSQIYLGKRAHSAMLRANGKNMLGDVVISSGVLLGLGLSILFQVPILDPLVAIGVGLWVIRSAISIFWEVNTELMDGNGEPELYQALFEAVRSVPGTVNPHRARMRRIAGLWDIDLDIEVHPELSVREAHHLASAVERAIKERVDGVYDIMVHIEPEGEADRHPLEQYGLREGDET
ncbi:MAG: cation diffusion facilitator family transporter [Treponemataceae bacterium]|nr:cation diffusion facilitator family transporter [Treponemataceae bacterium]